MSIRKQGSAWTIAALAACLAGGALAQTTGSTGMDKGAGTGAASTAKSADAKLTGSERRFLETAARHGVAEVAMGKMAAEKAQNREVKDFGKRMADDHAKANDELKKLAEKKGVTLPSAPDASHQRTSERLAKLAGNEFDRAYMKEMVDDHRKDVREFRDMSKSAKDADVRAFASTNLPVLEEHLRLAQDIHAAVSKRESSDAKGGTATSAAPKK